MERVEFLGLPNCLRLTNGTVELTVATEIGPRILAYNLVGQRNLLGACVESSQATPWGDWKPWGGHRLWSAPESMPRSYVPDNVPVTVITNENSVQLIGKTEEPTKTQKEMFITLAANGAAVTIAHRITNRGLWPVRLAAWALTVMRGGGLAVVPQEPFRPFPEVLQPVRPVAMWSYTDLSDPRFTISGKFIRLQTDSSMANAQKFGVGNTLGWAAYLNEGTLFVKHFPFVPSETYPDFGCNTEVYTAGDFIELESLSPLRQLEPGQAVEHRERWTVVRDVVDDDESIAAAVTRA